MGEFDAMEGEGFNGIRLTSVEDDATVLAEFGIVDIDTETPSFRKYFNHEKIRHHFFPNEKKEIEATEADEIEATEPAIN
jgi:hypothetical protein